MSDLAALRDLAVEVAKEAGELLLNHRPKGSIEAGTKSSPTDLVTVMDTKSEAFIRAALRAARPEDGFLGEESGDHPGSSGVRWIVDPIDGTVNYRYRLPHWSVSIAAEVAGEVAVGVVYDPSYAEMWSAVRGAGAQCNGEPVRCSTESRLDQALVATGFGYAAAMRAQQAEVLRHVLPRVRDVRRFGSCAIDLCWTAAGRYDAYYEGGPQVWDFSAGTLIAREAGARVEGLAGRRLGDPLVIAAGPGIFADLHDLLLPLHHRGPGSVAPG